MTRADRKASASQSSEGTKLAKRFAGIDFSSQAVMDRVLEKQETFQKQERTKKHTEAIFKARTRMAEKVFGKNSKLLRSELVSEKQTDLDKSVKEIEELLSQKYGSSPYESSINYDQSDSDFQP